MRRLYCHRRTDLFTGYGCLFLLLLIYEYNTTVDFYWAPFESNSDDPLKHSVSDRIIMPESIKKLGDKWKGVEYLIFNTKQGTFNEGATEYDEIIERTAAFGRVLMRTWVKWLEENVDPNLTSGYFISMSPMHFRYSERSAMTLNMDGYMQMEH
ncbi:hypothetical protein POTOM_031221 [Populus tomentosa]|uniref:Trichome birefringence-like C-terminal domain-containing protein n=1 Tax=Populus tomentosa TaxID=118781 RepID=A0A8X7Z711_POPTO|nr:hypothetical protein POTOM_031221 [Populus tomentosa]